MGTNSERLGNMFKEISRGIDFGPAAQNFHTLTTRPSLLLWLERFFIPIAIDTRTQHYENYFSKTEK